MAVTRLRRVADGVATASLSPLVRTVVLDDGVVVDSGLRWTSRRLARVLTGVDVSAHVVTHAHADHLGGSAWLCRHAGVPLQMGAADADAFEHGDIATVASPLGRALARRAEPERCPVGRRLAEGDAVGSFRVLEVPGHTAGNLALWREDDGVLVVGDAPVNLSRDPRRPRFVHLPRSLHDDAGRVPGSRRRLAALRPRLVVPVHGRPVADPDAWARALTG